MADKKRVYFTLSAPDAKDVQVLGSFSEWAGRSWSRKPASISTRSTVGGRMHRTQK